MTRHEFLNALETQLELPENMLTEDDAVADIPGWDSMAAVLFIALTDEQLGISVSARQISDSKTVKDLVDLAGSRLTD